MGGRRTPVPYHNYIVHLADTIGFEMNQGRGSSASEAVKLYQKSRITHCGATAKLAATHLTSVLFTPQRI